MLEIEAKLESVEHYMRKAGLYKTDEIRPVNEARMRARWRLGQLLAEIERSAGPGRGKKKDDDHPSFLGYLKQINLHKHIAIFAQRSGTLPVDDLEEAFADAREHDSPGRRTGGQARCRRPNCGLSAGRFRLWGRLMFGSANRASNDSISQRKRRRTLKPTAGNSTRCNRTIRVALPAFLFKPSPLTARPGSIAAHAAGLTVPGLRTLRAGTFRAHRTTGEKPSVASAMPLQKCRWGRNPYPQRPQGCLHGLGERAVMKKLRRRVTA